MFMNAIETFRPKSYDKVLVIDEDTQSDQSYEICSDFLDLFAHDDDEEIRALNDYITFGQHGDGFVYKRLLDILVGLCKRYKNTTAISSNNKSYCNSTITSFERAESYLLG